MNIGTKIEFQGATGVIVAVAVVDGNECVMAEMQTEFGPELWGWMVVSLILENGGTIN